MWISSLMSYTPSKVSICAGDGFHNSKELKTVEFVKPIGWVYISFCENDPWGTFVNTFMLQIAVSMEGIPVRQIKVYFTKHSPQYKILMLDHVLGGIANSHLFPAFESWLVAKHNMLG